MKQLNWRNIVMSFMCVVLGFLLLPAVLLLPAFLWIGLMAKTEDWIGAEQSRGVWYKKWMRK